MPDTMRTLLLLVIVALSSASIQDLEKLEDVQNLPEKKPVKRHYVCPPNFVRLSHRCYFFSKEEVSWNEAFFSCQKMRSNLAIVKNKNQDKLLRRTLSQKTLAPLERWIGAKYDWKEMQWKWAASGKPTSFNGFEGHPPSDKEKLSWHCLVLDPTLDYRWNPRSCFEQKRYICQTKIKTVTNKGKKKLQKKFNTDKYNKLNEIPVPNLPYGSDASDYRKQPISFKFEVNRELMDAPAYTSKPVHRKNKRKNRKNKKKHMVSSTTDKGSNLGYFEGTPSVLTNDAWSRTRRTKANHTEPPNGIDTPIEHIKWRTYKKEGSRENPLYPKPIVEEFNYVKE